MVKFEVFDARNEKSFNNYGSKEIVKPFLIRVMVDGICMYPSCEDGKQPAFATEEDARSFIDSEKFQMPEAWAIFKNADFTEGRGPMLMYKVYYNLKDAHDYVMQSEGIYGSSQYENYSMGINIDGEAYAYKLYNGYEIQPLFIN